MKCTLNIISRAVVVTFTDVCFLKWRTEYTVTVYGTIKTFYTVNKSSTLFPFFVVYAMLSYFCSFFKFTK